MVCCKAKPQQEPQPGGAGLLFNTLQPLLLFDTLQPLHLLRPRVGVDTNACVWLYVARV